MDCGSTNDDFAGRIVGSSIYIKSSWVFCAMCNGQLSTFFFCRVLVHLECRRPNVLWLASIVGAR